MLDILNARTSSMQGRTCLAQGLKIALNSLAFVLAVLILSLTLRMAVSLTNSIVPQTVEGAELIPVANTVTPTPQATRPAGNASPMSTPHATVQPTPSPATATPSVPMLVAGPNGVNVRTGPGTDYERVGVLTPGTQAQITGRSGEWWQIRYAEQLAWVFSGIVSASNVNLVPEVAPPSNTPLPTPSPTSNPTPVSSSDIQDPRWIDVDLTEQRLTAYEGETPVRSFLVSTGLPQTPTPVGQFRIWIKLRYDDMSGPGYYIEDVPFVMYFHQGYGLHGVTWHGNFGQPMSHGCVNLPTDQAEWLFNFADVGTLVNIHE